MTTIDSPFELLTTTEYKAKLNQCIHCGLCLEACPTYAVFGTEMDGPRGRIALMRAASEGRFGPAELDGVFSRHINRCLACRSCETACPSGVQYGSLVETARVLVETSRKPALSERFLRWVGLRQSLPYLNRLKLIARLLWLYQVTGLQKMVRAMNILPKTLSALEMILPPIEPAYSPDRGSVPAIGEQRGRVALFTGCIQEAFLAPVNQATVRVLQRNGYDVHFLPGQTCCGAAQVHAGEEAFTRKLARQNIDTFLNGAFEAIISNAGGCGLMLKEYPHLFANDPAYAERARQFSTNVKDVNEFLVDHLTVPPAGEVKGRVTYVDSCHLRHGQRVVQAPRELLKQVPGLELVELNYPDQCCGSAGIYNITQVETARTILDAKMADISAAGAELVVTSNTGCQMQLIAGVRQAGLPARVMHVVEVLDESYVAGAAS